MYLEPAADGHDEARHRANMKALFACVANLATVADSHAGHLDTMGDNHLVLLDHQEEAVSDLALKFKSTQLNLQMTAGETKDIIEVAEDKHAQLEKEVKVLVGLVEANDFKLKADVSQSFQGVWGFLEANNAGIAQMFGEADAAVKLLVRRADEQAAMPLLQPSAVAAGPKGLAFVGLRADLKKMQENLEATQALLEATRAEANVAANAAGPARPAQNPPGFSPSGDGMAQL